MEHRGEAGEPGEMELLVAQTHHHRDLDGLAVWGAEIDAFAAAAEEQERALDLLRVAMQSVGESHTVADGGGEDVFTLEERAEEPRGVSYEAELVRVLSELAEYLSAISALEIRQDMARS